MKPETKYSNNPARRARLIRILFLAAIAGVTPLFAQTFIDPSPFLAPADAQGGGPAVVGATPNVPPPRPVTATNVVVPPDISAIEQAAVARAAGDKRLFEFHAENLELKAALALFARGNKLNIVPDNDVT